MIDSLNSQQQVAGKQEDQTLKDTSQPSKQQTDYGLDNCPLLLAMQPTNSLPQRQTKPACLTAGELQILETAQPTEVSEAASSKQTFQLIVVALMQLGDQLSRFSKDVQNFDSRLSRLQSQNDENNNKQLRKMKKRLVQSVSQYECRIQDCRKSYASSLSLKLHQKLKHPTAPFQQQPQLAQSQNSKKPK